LNAEADRDAVPVKGARDHQRSPRRAAHRRHWFLPAAGALVVVAWTALWLWEQSPYGRYLDHGDWTKVGIAGALCSAVPAGEAVVPAVLYVGGWVLMLTAMMLPTTLPLLETYRRLTQRRADRWQLLGLVVAGYLSVWFGFGIAAHIADLALHEALAGSSWLTFNGWAIGAIVVALAGAFQFSALKYRCLEKCRTPYGFIAERWRGKAPLREAFRIGFDNGAFCVGCCWALMLVMFVVGMGNVGWMLALGALMAIEKNLPWGKKLSAPLGVTLLAWAGAIVLANV
jgi:predicted metal-binding membrane protein